MAVLPKFFPNRLFVWIIFCYLSSGVVIAANAFDLGTHIQVLVFLVLFSYTSVFVVDSVLGLLHVIKSKRTFSLKEILLNTVLGLIAFPAVVSLILPGIQSVRMGRSMAVIFIQDTFYEKVDYRKLEGFPFCGLSAFDTKGVTISNQQQYDLLREKSKSGSELCMNYNFPEIDFKENIILISSVVYGDCDEISLKVYKDGIGRRIIHSTNIKHGTGVCTLRLNSSMDAILVPKIEGYRIEFQFNNY